MPRLPNVDWSTFLQTARAVFIGALLTIALACCIRRGPAQEPRYPGFCLNPATGEANPRYDELCKNGGIVCPYSSRVSSLPDGPGIGFRCEPQ